MVTKPKTAGASAPEPQMTATEFLTAVGAGLDSNPPRPAAKGKAGVAGLGSAFSKVWQTLRTGGFSFAQIIALIGTITDLLNSMGPDAGEVVDKIKELFQPDGAPTS